MSNTKRIMFRFDDETNKQIQEIVKKRNEIPYFDKKYDQSTAIREGIFYAYQIIVNDDFELVPTQKWLEKPKSERNKINK